MTNKYVQVHVSLTPIEHGQIINFSELLKAYNKAIDLGATHLISTNHRGKRFRVEIHAARRCLIGFGDERTLVVKHDDSGFIFSLTDERKRENLRRNGYSEEEVERLMMS